MQDLLTYRSSSDEASVLVGPVTVTEIQQANHRKRFYSCSAVVLPIWIHADMSECSHSFTDP